MTTRRSVFGEIGGIEVGEVDDLRLEAVLARKLRGVVREAFGVSGFAREEDR